jgi:FAD-dependent oxidoreductase domain-containing protein 1
MSMFGTAFLRRAEQDLALDGVGPGVHLHEGGYLFLATSAGQAVLAANHATQRIEGAGVVWLDAAAMQRRFPWLATHDLAAATLGLSGEGWLDAHALLHGLRRRAIAAGARYLHAEVTALQRDGRKISGVRLADGRSLEAEVVIIAAGTGAARLAQSVGI